MATVFNSSSSLQPVIADDHDIQPHLDNATYATLELCSFDVDIKQSQSTKATTKVDVTETNENSQKDTFNSSRT